MGIDVGSVPVVGAAVGGVPLSGISVGSVEVWSAGVRRTFDGPELDGLIAYMRGEGMPFVGRLTSLNTGDASVHPVDGNPSTVAGTLSDPDPWWSIDLGRGVAASVNHMMWSTQYKSVPNFWFFGSNDHSTWTNLITVSDGSGPTNAGEWWDGAVADETPYRYFKIQRNGNDYTRIAEFELWGTLTVTTSPLPTGDSRPFPGSPTDLSGLMARMRELGLPIGASMSSYNVGDGTQAVDGNPNTVAGTLTAGSNQWLRFDLGEGVAAIVDHAGLRTSYTSLPSFQVQGSNDDATWNVLCAVSGTGPMAEDWWHGPSADQTPYRYLRVQRIGDSYTRLGEFEVWGTLVRE